jgi:hypothetical protein
VVQRMLAGPAANSVSAEKAMRHMKIGSLSGLPTLNAAATTLDVLKRPRHSQ